MSSSSQSLKHASCNPLRWTLTSMGVFYLCLHLLLILLIGLHVLLGLISINWFSENKTSWLFSPVSSCCDFFYRRASLPVCKQDMKVLVWIFSAQYGPIIKFHKLERNFRSFCRGYPWFAQNFWKILPKYFIPEIPRKNLHWIWDKTRKISGQTDEYSPTKKTKQFHTQTNLPFSPGSDE